MVKRKQIVTVLCAAVVGLVSVGMPVRNRGLFRTAVPVNAVSVYDSYVGTTDTVYFNDVKWYVIADNSTAADVGTVTLFASNTIGMSHFDDNGISNVYADSTIRSYLDSLTAEGGSFEDVADAIKSVDLEDVNVTGAKLYLISDQEANALSAELRKCQMTSRYWYYLRTSGKSTQYAYNIHSTDGEIRNDGNVKTSAPIGVRPALQLDLSRVAFNESTKTFALSVPDSEAVASVTDDSTTTGYGDFAAALSAWKGGSTLTLLDDVTVSSHINVTGTKKFDLNGHKLTLNNVYFSMQNTSTSLEITDTATGGEIEQVGKSGVVYGTWSNLTISGGKLIGTSSYDWAVVCNTNTTYATTVTLSGGEIICPFSDAISLYGSGAINLTGGKITSTSTQSSMTTSSAVLPRSGFTGTVNWSSTEIVTNIGCGVYVRDAGTPVNVTGGSFTTTGTNIPANGGYAISGNAQGAINIGGSLALGGKGIYLLNDKKVAITDTLSITSPIGVTMQTPGTFTNTAYNDSTKFSSDNESYAIGKNADGQLYIGNPVAEVSDGAASVTYDRVIIPCMEFVMNPKMCSIRQRVLDFCLFDAFCSSVSG